MKISIAKSDYFHAMERRGQSNESVALNGKCHGELMRTQDDPPQ
jgi:hypothetical protein